jgi:hypothetical protein
LQALYLGREPEARVATKTKANNYYLGHILNIVFRKWFFLFKVPSARTTIPEKSISPTSQES